MKSSLLILALLTAAAAQESTQGQMCSKAAVMPPPSGNTQNRMLSDDAEVADRDWDSLIEPRVVQDDDVPVGRRSGQLPGEEHVRRVAGSLDDWRRDEARRERDGDGGRT